MRRRLGRILDPRWLVLLLLLVFVAFFSQQSILRHERLSSRGYDLGNVDQAIWNTAQGRPFKFTNWTGKDNYVLQDSRLGMHVEPILLLIAPIFRIWDDVRALLILQATVVGLGGLGIWALARWALRAADNRGSDVDPTILGHPISSWAALAVAAAFWLNPGLQWAILDDFHAVTLVAGLLPFACYFMLKGRYLPFSALAVLIAATREEMPLVVALMGLYVLFFHGWRGREATQRHRAMTIGALVFVAGVAWSATAFLVVIPHFNADSQSPYVGRYADLLGEGGLTLDNLPHLAFAVLKTMLDRKGLVYLFGLLLPTAFTSLIGWPVLMLGAVSFAVNVLSNNPLTTVQGRHHIAPLVPVLYAATALGVDKLSQWVTHWRRRRESAIPSNGPSASHRRLNLVPWLPLLISVVVLGASLGVQIDQGFTPLARDYVAQGISPHHRLAQRFFDQIPPEASVTTSQSLNPHLSHREQITIMPFDFSGEYILFDLTCDWPAEHEPEAVTCLIERIVESPAYSLIDAADGFVFLRGNAQPPSPHGLGDFTRTLDVQPQYPMQVSFEDRLRFLGFDYLQWRSGEGAYGLYWEMAHPLDEDEYHVVLYLADDQFRLKGAVEIQHRELIWYLPSRRQPGETIQILVLELPWDSRSLGEYSVALGVLRGRELWEPSNRIPPMIDSSGQSPRLLDSGTLLHLMRLQWGEKCPEPRPEPRQGDPPPSITPGEAQFADLALLLGHQIQEDTLCAGEALEVDLYWRAIGTTDQAYTVFVHLVGPDGRLYGQQDNPPGNGTLATDRWQPGDLIRDSYRLMINANAPPGDYRLAVGLYDPATLERLQVQGAQATSVAIEGITVMP
jgi:uncharacterized membrane protein